MDYFDEVSKASKRNVQTFDEFENRYEPQETYILGKFILNNLVFARSTLKLTDPSTIANLLHVYWETLDIFACNEYDAADSHSVENAMKKRFETLKGGLMSMHSLSLLSFKEISQCV